MSNRAIAVARSVRRGLQGFVRSSSLFDPLRIDRAVSVKDRLGESIENLRVLSSAEEVGFGAGPEEQEFLRICKYYNKGSYLRPETFVCEVPDAYAHVGTGLICTSDAEPISDSQMAHVIECSDIRRWLRPIGARRLRGTYASIHNIYWNCWWHWIIDCLPRIYTLYQAYPGERVVLLAPGGAGPTFKQSLDAALPPNFEIRYMPYNTWVKADRMLLASYTSSRCNGHLPAPYFDFLRRTVITNCGLPPHAEATRRLFVSRSKSRYRHIINESELIGLLGRYGFETVWPEELAFRDQVELFRSAEIVVGAHGSAWGNLVFSGPIPIVVLYPDMPPNTHIFTTAKGMNQSHHFLAYREPTEYSSFRVDLAAMRDLLEGKLGLRPTP